MGIESYAPPVDKLLTYGDAHEHGGKPQAWPEYLELGIGPEHIPDLIRMATDEELRWADSESLEVWAPIHAWRTLGALHAEAVRCAFSVSLDVKTQIAVHWSPPSRQRLDGQDYARAAQVSGHCSDGSSGMLAGVGFFAT